MNHYRVLLAEDNPVNQEVAREILEGLGCIVDVAANGREAVEAFVSKPYDLIFMDCQMPEMDGYEATRIIREREKSELTESENGGPGRPHITIIALTAHALQGYREECLSAGMDDYLSKPFRTEQLEEILNHWTKGKTEIAGPPRGCHDGAACVSSDQQTLGGTKEGTTVEGDPSLNQNPIDYKALEQIYALQKNGSPDLLKKVIDMFLRDAPERIATIRDAVMSGNATTIQRTAHSLKSSSATVGAMALSSLCKELESMGGTNTVDHAPELLSRVEAEYRAVEAALHGSIPGTMTS